MVVWIYEGTGAGATKKPLLDPIAYLGGVRTPVNEIHAYEAGFKRTLVWSRTPLELTVTVSRWDTAVLTWTMPGAGADSFRVLRNGQQIYTGTNMAYTNVNLFPDTDYTFTVEALRAAAVVSTDSETVRTPARDLTLAVTAYTHNSVSIAWTDPVPGTISAYQILRNGAPLVTLGVPGSNTWTDSDLTYNATYTYQVKAFRSGGEILPASNIVSQTLSARPPMVLTASSPSWHSAALAWTDLASDQTADVSLYRLQRGTTVLSSTISNTQRAYNDTNTLLPSTAYTYTLTALGFAGEVVATATATATTPARADMGLAEDTKTWNSIKVKWTDAGGGGIDTHSVWRSGQTAISVPVATTSQNFTGLASATAYTFYLDAKRGATVVPAQDSVAITTATRGTVQKTYSKNCTSSCSYTGDPNWTPKISENSVMWHGDAGGDNYNDRYSAAVWSDLPAEIKNCHSIVSVRVSFRCTGTPNASATNKASIGIGMGNQLTDTWPVKWPSGTPAFRNYPTYRGASDVWVNGTEWITITNEVTGGKAVKDWFRTDGKKSICLAPPTGHLAKNLASIHASKTSVPSMRPRLEIVYKVWEP